MRGVKRPEVWPVLRGRRGGERGRQDIRRGARVLDALDIRNDIRRVVAVPAMSRRHIVAFALRWVGREEAAALRWRGWREWREWRGLLMNVKVVFQTLWSIFVVAAVVEEVSRGRKKSKKMSLAG